MELIYLPSDAQRLISSMNHNINSSQAVVDDLRSASKQLMSALSSGKLEGAAYRAGKSMFAQWVLPTLNQADCVLNRIKSDLKGFQEAVGQAGGELLHEGILKERLRMLQQEEQNIYNHMFRLGNLSMIHQDDPVLQRSLAYQQSQAQNWLNYTHSEVDKVREKLGQLHDFNGSVNVLFIGAEEDLHLLGITIEAGGSGSFNSRTGEYTLNKAVKDFLKSIKDGGEYSQETLSKVIEAIGNKALKEGKNIGKSYGSKLRPRNSKGRFKTDSFKPRKWVSGKLYGMSNVTSKNIGYIAKGGGPVLGALSAYGHFSEYKAEYNNTGRAFAYAGIATGAGIWAGSVGSALGGTVAAMFANSAIGASLASTGLVALSSFALPILGAVVVGAAAGVALKAVYENFKPFKDMVDGIGDGFNNIGKSLDKPLSSLTGAFQW